MSDQLLSSLLLAVVVGGSTFGGLVKSTRPDLRDSSVVSVDGKRFAKREKTVLVSFTPSSVSSSPTLPTFSPVSNSSVLATAPVDDLGVAVKRS